MQTFRHSHLIFIRLVALFSRKIIRPLDERRDKLDKAVNEEVDVSPSLCVYQVKWCINDYGMRPQHSAGVEAMVRCFSIIPKRTIRKLCQSS